MSSYIRRIPFRVYYVYQSRLYYTQCRHTYCVFQDSIPLLFLSSSVSSPDVALRLVVYACSIIIGTISDMFSCFILKNNTFTQKRITSNMSCYWSNLYRHSLCTVMHFMSVFHVQHFPAITHLSSVSNYSNHVNYKQSFMVRNSYLISCSWMLIFY